MGSGTFSCEDPAPLDRFDVTAEKTREQVALTLLPLWAGIPYSGEVT